MTSDRSSDDRVRQAWRMPAELIQFLKKEAKHYRHDVSQFAVRLFRALENYYELPEAIAAVLERDRRAMRMSRWNYLSHALLRRAQAVEELDPGFDAPKTAAGVRRGEATSVPGAQWSTTGAKVMQSWFLPRDLREFLIEEAKARGQVLTPFATSVLNAYASFFPLPEVAAALLERDRRAANLGRWEYFRHLWYQRAEAIRERGVRFDSPSTNGSHDSR